MSVTERYRTLPGKRYPERYPLPPLKGNGNGNAPERLGCGETLPAIPGASRIPGQGRILRSLRSLLRRVERYALHRARTDAEHAWSRQVADALDQALTLGLQSATARASLASADQRAVVRGKVTRPLTGPTSTHTVNGTSRPRRPTTATTFPRTQRPVSAPNGGVTGGPQGGPTRGATGGSQQGVLHGGYGGGSLGLIALVERRGHVPHVGLSGEPECHRSPGEAQ